MPKIMHSPRLAIGADTPSPRTARHRRKKMRCDTMFATMRWTWQAKTFTDRGFRMNAHANAFGFEERMVYKP